MAINDPITQSSVANVGSIDAVQSTKPSLERNPQKKEQREREPRKKVQDYFHPLKKAVEESNKRLIERKLPYRFSVFKRWGEVYLELFILDDTGTVKEKQRKNITRSDFNRIIEDVSKIAGLFFDYHA